MFRAAMLALTGLVALACQSQPLDVAQVDLQRMQGRWYEVAKLPRPSQRDCFGTTSDYVVVSPSELQVVNQCHKGSLDGPLERVAARAVATDPATPAKLSLDFGFAYGDYWLI